MQAFSHAQTKIRSPIEQKEQHAGWDNVPCGERAPGLTQVPSLVECLLVLGRGPWPVLFLERQGFTAICQGKLLPVMQGLWRTEAAA